MYNKQMVVLWMLDKIIEHNGILPMEVINQAIGMHNEQLSTAYLEGFKRCKYISELEEGTLFFPGEQTPDDFDTYYKKTYGEQTTSGN